MNTFKYPRMNAVLHELWLQQQGIKTSGFRIDGDRVTVFIEPGSAEKITAKEEKTA